MPSSYGLFPCGRQVEHELLIAVEPQQALDTLLRLDGDEEFVLYLAPTGKKAV